MAKAKTENELKQVQVSAERIDEQLGRLYRNLAILVTAAGTLNEELGEMPSSEQIQDLVLAVKQLRKELRWFGEREWKLPDSDSLDRCANVASRLAGELARAKVIWDGLPSEEIKSKLQFAALKNGKSN